MSSLVQNIRQGGPARWLILNNRDSYLGTHRPRGVRAVLYNIAMVASIVTVVASAVYSTSVGLGWL